MNFTATSPAIATYTQGDRTMPLLTDPKIYQGNLDCHRFFVQVITNEWEVQDNFAVPKDSEVIDVLVIEPTETAIKKLVAETCWLEGWRVESFWRPTEDSIPF